MCNGRWILRRQEYYDQEEEGAFAIHEQFFRLWSVLPRKDRSECSQEAAHALDDVQGMRRHILELVEKPIGKNRAQSQSLLAKGFGRGGDWGRRSCPVPRLDKDAPTSIYSC